MCFSDIISNLVKLPIKFLSIISESRDQCQRYSETFLYVLLTSNESENNFPEVRHFVDNLIHSADITTTWVKFSNRRAYNFWVPLPVLFKIFWNLYVYTSSIRSGVKAFSRDPSFFWEFGVFLWHHVKHSEPSQTKEILISESRDQCPRSSRCPSDITPTWAKLPK